MVVRDRQMLNKGSKQIQELTDTRSKYDNQVARSLELTRAKKKAEDALHEASRTLEKEREKLHRVEAELKTLSSQHEQLSAHAKEMGEDLVSKKNSLSRANDTIKELKEEVAQHLKSITDEQTARQKGEVQIAQLAYQLDFSQAKNKNLKAEVKELQNLTSKHKEEISDLKAIVAQKEKEISGAMSSLRYSHTVVCHQTVGIAKGIGLTLCSPDTGVCRIESIIPGGVADQEGSLQVGDVLTEVDRIPLHETGMDEIHEILSGTAGTSVTICATRKIDEGEDESVRAILFRAGIEACSDDAQQLCTDINETAESLRGQLASSQNALKEVTVKYDQLQADYTREMSRLQSHIDELRGKQERLTTKNNELQMSLKTTETQLSECQSTIGDLEAQNLKEHQNLQRLTGVHEQLKVSFEEMKSKMVETVKELEELRDKLSRTQAELKDQAKECSNLQKMLDEQGLIQRKLEKHLDTEQARSKNLNDEVNKMKGLIHKKELDISELKSQLADAQREKEDAHHTIQTLSGELKEQARRQEVLSKDLNTAQQKLSQETERSAELSFSLDRANDLEKKLTREVNDLKRKLDGEIFAKDQSLRREETHKRNLIECREYAAQFKVQAEAEISQLRREVVSICGFSQKTHAKVCGQVVGSAAGVGLFLLDGDSSGDFVKVESVAPGRSASLDGRIAPGDEILEVDGEDVRKRRAEYINTLLAGETGSSVTVKAQKPSGGSIYSATFVRSSAKSRCSNSQDVSDLCRDVELVQESLKSEVAKLQDKISAMERRHAQDVEQAAQDYAKLSAQLEDSEAKLSRAVQKNLDAIKAREALQDNLDASNELIKNLRAQLEAAKLNQVNVEEVKRAMEKKLRFHEKQLRHWAAQHAAVLRETCNNMTHTFRDIEGGVLDVTRSNSRYANELDTLQVTLSKLEPELELVNKKLSEAEEQVGAGQDRIRQLEHECRLHDINRGDILAQLQDALLREADLRESVAALGKERDKLKERVADAESTNSALESKLKRANDQVRLLDNKLADARDIDHARQQELASLERKLADANDKLNSQVTKLSKDLDMAYNAARQMHMSVCRPVVGLTCGIGILVSSAGKAGGCRIASVETTRDSKSTLQTGDLILEIDGQDVQHADTQTVQSMLIGPLGSEVNLVVQHANSEGTVSANMTRGSAGAGCSTVVPDLLRDVKATAATLHADLDKLRSQNAHLKEKMSQMGVAHEEELRKLRAAQADIQIQLDTQLRNVADKERINRSLQQVNKDQALKMEESDKQLRAANARIQELEDEIARLELQREDLKKGNAAARESLRKASSDIKAMQGVCVLVRVSAHVCALICTYGSQFCCVLITMHEAW